MGMTTVFTINEIYCLNHSDNKLL